MDRLKVIVGMLAIGLLGSVTYGEEPPKRILIDGNAKATEALLTKLREEPLEELDFSEGTPLEEVVAYLNSECDLSLQLDERALGELGIGPDDPVKISIRDVTLGTALTRLLEPLELTYVVQDGLIQITSQDEALTHLMVAVYPVADLLTDNPKAYSTLIDTITATVAPHSWQEKGGGEAEICAFFQRGSLVVSQTTSGHETLRSLLEALRQAPVDPKSNNAARADGFGGGYGGGFGRGGGFGGEYGGRERPKQRKDVGERAKKDRSEKNADAENDPFGGF